MDSPEILSSSETSDASINLDILPSEMVEKILLESDLRTILNFCLTSKTANQYCQSGNFWKKKYQQDYHNFTPLEKGDNWKERYQRESILAAQLQFGNISISAGFDHWGFIDSSSIYTIGKDIGGQRGHLRRGDILATLMPSLTIHQLDSAMNVSVRDKYSHEYDILTKISLNSEIVSLSFGLNFAGVVTKNGKVYMWGSERYMLHLPQHSGYIFEVTGLQNQKAVKIVTGKKRGYAIFMESGEIYIRNHNNRYRILPAFKNRIVDIAIISAEEDDIYILDQKGQVGVFDGDNDITPVNLPEPIKQLSAGGNFWVALSKSGNVYTWGHNYLWQLGFKPVYQPTFDAVILGISKMREYFGYRSMRPKYKLNLPHPISFISAGDWTVAAVSKNGKLYMWGLNNLGNIDTNNRNRYVLPTEVNIKTKVKYVSLGGSFTVAMGMDSKIYFWGDPSTDPAGDGFRYPHSSQERYKSDLKRQKPVLGKLYKG